MLAFKPKTNKKINVCKKYLTTLGGKHAEFVNEFMFDETDTIPKLKSEKKMCKYRLTNEELTIEEEMEIKDRIIEIILLSLSLCEVVLGEDIWNKWL